MVLRNGKPSTIVVTVRKDSIHVMCDEQVIINWKGDPKRLSLNPINSVPDKRALFIVSRTSYHITKMTLTPIEGEGKRIDD